MKKFKDFIEILKKDDNIITYDNAECEIESITYDSGDVKNNTLFFCKGLNFKEEYLLTAKNKGANSYISEKKYNVDLPNIIVKDIRKAIMELAKFFYDNPDKYLKIIGVTGTKGKSTTSVYIKNILDKYLQNNQRKPAGIISTIYNFYGEEDLDPSLTTPEALNLYKNFRKAVDYGIEYMVVETSSQAFKYYRTNNLEYDISIFLNIGEDHVSPLEHSSFEDYFNSKLMIFNNSKIAIINEDMDHIDLVKNRLKDLGKNYLTFSSKNEKSSLYLLDYEHKEKILSFNVRNNKSIRNFELSQIATYNTENALAAILAADYFGIDYKSIYDGLKTSHVEGREYILETEDKNLVYVLTYAHNGLSFRKVYDFIMEKYPNYKILSIYGVTDNAAENRIRGMVEESVKVSDHIYIIPDYSYRLTFDVVAEKIIKYLKKYTSNYTKVDDKEKAIKLAASQAGEKTVIFMEANGIIEYQIVMGKKVKIRSDYEVAKEVIDLYNLKLNNK